MGTVAYGANDAVADRWPVLDPDYRVVDLREVAATVREEILSAPGLLYLSDSKYESKT